LDAGTAVAHETAVAFFFDTSPPSYVLLFWPLYVSWPHATLHSRAEDWCRKR
jgi:hypothetical protein